MSFANTHSIDPLTWLKATAAPGSRPLAAATAMLVLDSGAAVAFAVCLAAALAALPQGLERAELWLVLGMMAALARAGLAWASTAFGAAGSAACRVALRRRAAAAAFAGGATKLRASGEKLAVVVDGVEAIDGYLARFLPARRAVAPACLLVLCGVALASPVSAAILAGTLVPFLALMVLAGGAAADGARRQFTARTRLSSLFIDRVRVLPVVLMFQSEERDAAILATAADEVRRRTMGVLRIALVSSAGLDFFAALAVALVALYVGLSLLGQLPFRPPEALDLPRAVFVLALAPELYAPLRRLAATYHDKQTATATVGPLRAHLAATLPRMAELPMFTAAPRIWFDRVTVHYPGEDRPALENFSADVPPGEITVLLGPSGSGKTTLLNLLLALAPLTDGEVWIGADTLQASGSAARAISWVGQSPVVLPGSIGENIALSCPGASREALEDVAARVGLCTLLRCRPGGLDAVLDERGGSLSGGERRRLALARALLKPAPILLLDEPTAGLDEGAEVQLAQVIRRAARGRTTIIATHSPVLAAIAHRIVLLEAP